MKLHFNPNDNISKFDYTITQFNRTKKVKGKFNDLLSIRNIIKNWPDVLFFRLGLKKSSFTMELRNGLKIKISKPVDYFEFWNNEEGQKVLLEQNNLEKIKINRIKKQIKFNFMNKTISLIYASVQQLDSTLGVIMEQFIEEQYNWLDVKGNDVIDIGANIGDSAIYFALKRAKHVYAFEPYPYSFNLASKNIKLNGLQNKITLLNEGCTEKEGSINIDANYQNTGSTDLKKFSKGKEIRLTTLANIIKRFNISSSASLKIDCEGCEYSILLKANNTDLRRFKQIQIEYHYGYLNLKKKLEAAGFKLSKTTTIFSLNNEAENKKMFVGFIYAERTNKYELSNAKQV